ncbi:hypothetical protein [Caldisericum exile]|uniref:Uncharacterized protein n=1 Tax=Caldisericum exile (strain DSM 21853 / NBRC 104410 / AZM16c01) TaxID=511051 RepID=A0A7U6JF97_CALEA|nr:hypothetical protein [Caldisericum exile]BAL80194.1 hypothetical protein CSE_00680 [Caldisericum exile AZM16c01]
MITKNDKKYKQKNTYEIRIDSIEKTSDTLSDRVGEMCSFFGVSGKSMRLFGASEKSTRLEHQTANT